MSKKVTFVDEDDPDIISSDEEIDSKQLEEFNKIKDNLKLVHPNKYTLIPKKTRIAYITTYNKIIFNKYCINVKDDKLNLYYFIGTTKKKYNMLLTHIKQLYTYGEVTVGGGNDEVIMNIPIEDKLKNTILLPKKDWNKIRSDTVLSYKKKSDNKFIYNVKFNSIIEKNGIIKFSLTNNTGFTYRADPTNFVEIYRHKQPVESVLVNILNDISEIKKIIKQLQNEIKLMKIKLI